MRRLAWCVLGVLACGSDRAATTPVDTFIPGPDGAIQPATAAVLENHGAPTRAGAFVAPAFTHANAANLHLDRTFAGAIYNGDSYAQPLYYDGGGSGDLIIAVSEQNEVSAFTPTGSAVWQVTLGSAQPMPNPSEGAPCGDINPLGISGTPVIDPSRQVVYLDAMINDGSAHHRVFALSLADGSVGSGWPLNVDSTVTSQTGVAFVSPAQNQRGSLTLLDNTLYVPYGGHAGDCGTYHGWVVAVPEDDPQHPTAFATVDTESGSWMPGGVSSDGANVFAVFGNGTPVDTWTQSDFVGRFGSGASFSGQPTDYWAPENWMTLDQNDIDLTGPAIPFDLPGSSPEHLLLSYGKDGNVYLHDRDNLGGIANPLGQLQASDGVIITDAALYQTTLGVYTAIRAQGHGCPDGNTNHNIAAIKITPGSPPTLSMAWCAGTYTGGDSDDGSPMVTTIDGYSDPIVWVVGAEGDGQMHGYDGDTGATIFGGGGSADAVPSTSRWITPMLAKGRIFVAGNGQLYAFTVN